MFNLSHHKLHLSISAFLIILICGASGFAETADYDEARQVGRNWLSYMTFQSGQWAGLADPEIISSEDIVVNDTVLARCFHISPRGYIIVPVLKDLHPVKAYSDESNLDLSEPDGFGVLLRDVLQHHVRAFVDIYGSMEAVPTEKQPALLAKHHRLEWDKFLVSDETFQAELASKRFETLEELGPLLESSWHQGSPYNNFCPAGDGGRCVVGCVATATAQIMKYHEWPPEGVGELTYYWYGDQSCGGNSPAQFLTAYFSDPYDWDNIGNYCGNYDPQEEQDAMAELNYEVGVALRMHYGVCGSGAYHFNVPDVFIDHFRFFEGIREEDRARYTYSNWSQLIKNQIADSLPFQYGIYMHSIVCDGWRQTDSATQAHFNYGWGGSHNSWYTIDDLHCPWEGCASMVESAIIDIIPDKRVHLKADTLWGRVPLEVSFDGISDLAVNDWIWDFGNGDTSSQQSLVYTYETPGRFDVTLTINTPDDTCSYVTTNYITALADSIVGINGKGNPGELVEVVIHSRNTVPLEMIRIPMEYDGTLDLSYHSFSTEGCRTDYFGQQKAIVFDPLNKRIAFSLLIIDDDTPFLEPGFGPVLKVYFTIGSSATYDQLANITLGGFTSYNPAFFGPILDYEPDVSDAVVTLYYFCGDVDRSEAINILDVTYILNYLYRSGPAPIPEISGDVNMSGGCDLLDITYLISYLYKGGPAPVCE